eukprot:scaffold5373_cov68-Phaeocystis_antarctica.AAC.10
MKYRPHQYDTSACASVGGVCPAVLNCDVRPISAHGTMRGRDCVVSLLPHVGWNPSVLPLELAPQAARVVRKAYPHAQYLATSLSSANGGPNNRVRCPNTEFANSELPGKGSNRMFANTLHFLDDQFRQLDRLHPRSLNGTGAARGSDCRLFASGGDALLTFTNHWNPPGTLYRSPRLYHAQLDRRDRPGQSAAAQGGRGPTGRLQCGRPARHQDGGATKQRRFRGRRQRQYGGRASHLTRIPTRAWWTSLWTSRLH